MLLMVTVLTAAGCTVVNIHTNDKNVTVKRGFGLVTVQLPNNDQTSIIETTGLGLVRTADGVALGYVNEKNTVAGKDCEIILYKPTAAEVKNMLGLIGSSDNVCLIKEEDPK